MEHNQAVNPAEASIVDGERRRGHYMGTEIDEVWYRRYRHGGFFARGTGEYWFEGRELYFRRYLTKEPLVIPLDRVKAVKLGSWHAGQWAMGRRAIKLVWDLDGRTVSSGFILARRRGEAEKLAETIRERARS